MEKVKERKIVPAPTQGTADTTVEKTGKSVATLADLFHRYRREGWSDSEIEMGIAGQ
ncbi:MULTISPECIES: hypothetical protein [unclassified Shinella]|jgi:hypothetical protein|uniref:hypothetical protein n=1 Tax=unclassified Shinella TaxID=2643062 RepID=UPI00140448E2|nr:MULTISPECIES: hypothetical protein [unclassified Shinella]MCA0339681.1 hypothetical protein [Pseudomonadota bacterium]MCO5151638.1 hypothetical protein [Shinella sp.]MDC7266355.1 hypothetical protein [Shinella sp. HY16]MDC7273252.1 hypothetical protein [Shinella sp. YZ44]